ncbi:MAG: type VI secretion system baseplate subunit TssE [Planctomycetaceae bacterium]|nr:type VI secretion system baseplate subunit TssE [Planctomycetaceae bacterium]
MSKIRSNWRTSSRVPSSFSIVDRLLDPDDLGDKMQSATPSQITKSQRRSINRDLEELLNTRTRCLSLPEHLEELNDSLPTFGLPDFGRHSFESDVTKTRFRESIEAAIARFEPRLSNVQVSVAHESLVDGIVRVEIEGFLILENHWTILTTDYSIWSGRFSSVGAP